MSVRIFPAILAAAAVLALSGCDRALVKVTNEAEAPMVMRYWHVNYDRWSPSIPFSSGEQMALARGHHFAEVRCLEITEDSGDYRYEAAALKKLHATCDRAHSCDLRYLGRGSVQATGSGL